MGGGKEREGKGGEREEEKRERWKGVNRGMKEDGVDEGEVEVVTSIAVGPTKAFGAAKDILRHFEAGGVPQANAHTTAIASELFDTDDLQGGMESFLTDGPGRATFTGS